MVLSGLVFGHPTEPAHSFSWLLSWTAASYCAAYWNNVVLIIYWQWVQITFVLSTPQQSDLTQHAQTTKSDGNNTSVKVSSHISHPNISGSAFRSLNSLEKSFRFQRSSKESKDSHSIPTKSATVMSLLLDSGTVPSVVLTSSFASGLVSWQQVGAAVASCLGWISVRQSPSPSSSKRPKSMSCWKDTKSWVKIMPIKGYFYHAYDTHSISLFF